MTNRRNLLRMSVGALALDLNAQSLSTGPGAISTVPVDNIELGALKLLIRTHNKARLGQATVSDYATANTALGFAALRWEASGVSAKLDIQIRQAVTNQPDQIISSDTVSYLHNQLVSLGSTSTLAELASALQLRETDRTAAMTLLSGPNALEKVVASASPRLQTISQSAVPAQAICDDCAWYGGWLLTFASAVAATLDLLAGGSLLSAANILTILSVICLLLG